MSDKKVLKEDWPRDHWAKSYRAGEEVDPVHVELLGIPSEALVGADTKTAERLQAELAGVPVEEPKRKVAKASDKNVDPAPNSPNGEANDPNRAAL